MNISIIGTGYVGLVTGACLAEKGHHVTCVDIEPTRVDALNRGQAPFFEAGLEDLLEKNAGRNLKATTNLVVAVLNSDLTIIAVGTPFDGRQIDLTAVLAASAQIGVALRGKPGYHVVVVKSSVVPGTTDQEVLPAIEAASGKRAGLDFGVGMNPEFLSEGEAVHDFMNPDRIVLGGIDERTIGALEKLYEDFDKAPRIRTNTRTAEMIKYASNSLLACLISFSNELANIGSAFGGIDAVEVMRGVHLSQYFTSRTGEGLPLATAFLKAGCGFGGSCLPKDVNALISRAREAGVSTPMLEAVIRTNEGQPGKVVELLKRHFTTLEGARIAVLGLSFKPGTSDVRESPAFPIIRQLLSLEAIVKAYDPVAMEEAKKALPALKQLCCESLDSALAEIDGVVIVTPWKQFDDLPALLQDRDSRVVVVDARRAFDKRSFARYEGIGV